MAAPQTNTSNASNSSSPSQKMLPKDAHVIISMMKDMGIYEYEPRVLTQLLEFSYRYVVSILEDSRMLAHHASKKIIDVDDIKLAVQMATERIFTSPPAREILLDVARTRNSIPLPFVKSHCGIRLPPDRYCLSSCNYKLRSIKKPQTKQLIQNINTNSAGYMNSAAATSMSTNVGMKVQVTGKPQQMTVTQQAGTQNIQLVKRAPVSTLTTVPRTQAITNPKPVIKFSSGQPLQTVQKAVAVPKIQVSTGQAAIGSANIVHTPISSTASIIKIETVDSMMEGTSNLKRKREDEDEDYSL